ncbi:MAG: L,D-transpeptidase [Gemmatimonadota bacterium]|nr:MAG: L,D-transpeptidase [Gemmatimonadota bacterium]
MIVPQQLISWEDALQKLESKFGLTSDEYALIVSIPEQKLRLVKGDETVRLYNISTSKNGAGNRAGSHKTPLGTHSIAEKIGRGAKFGSIFNARRNTGRTARIYTDNSETRKDLKTTRILWLKGMEPGINKGTGVDTFRRLIYIHGTPEEGLIGTPASHGCIRMKNGDVIELFDFVQEGTLVEIYN